MSALDDYNAAFLRLLENRPIRLPIGTKINNDTVALEAGRKRGSLKRSRIEHLPLIEKIKNATGESRKDASRLKAQIEKLKISRNEYKEKYELCLAREVMQLKRIADLENRLAEITQRNLHLIK